MHRYRGANISARQIAYHQLANATIYWCGPLREFIGQMPRHYCPLKSLNDYFIFTMCLNETCHPKLMALTEKFHKICLHFIVQLHLANEDIG